MNFKVGDYVYFESCLRKGKYGVCKIMTIIDGKLFGEWKNFLFIPSITEYERADNKSYGFMPNKDCYLLKPDNINKRI